MRVLSQGGGVAFTSIYVERHRKLHGKPSCAVIHIPMLVVVLLATPVFTHSCVKLVRTNLERLRMRSLKAWASWLDKETVDLLKGRVNVPRSHYLSARGVPTCKNVIETLLSRVLGFQDPRLDYSVFFSLTLTSDGEALILQWPVNEGASPALWRLKAPLERRS